MKNKRLNQKKLSSSLCALAAQSENIQLKSKGRAHIECGRRSLRPALYLDRSLRLDSHEKRKGVGFMEKRDGEAAAGAGTGGRWSAPGTFAKAAARSLQRAGFCLGILILSFWLLLCGSFSSFAASAVSFEELNSRGVFLKQKTSNTCTLASITMLMRRTALLLGKSDWESITEERLRPQLWTSQGMYAFGTYHSSKNASSRENYAFTYGYHTFSYDYRRMVSLADNRKILKGLLELHPEGVAVFGCYLKNGRQGTHAILLTDYTDGVFYCADPAAMSYPDSSRVVPFGRIPISQASRVTISNICGYWVLSSPARVEGPKTSCSCSRNCACLPMQFRRCTVA